MDARGETLLLFFTASNCRLTLQCSEFRTKRKKSFFTACRNAVEVCGKLKKKKKQCRFAFFPATATKLQSGVDTALGENIQTNSAANKTFNQVGQKL